jgi:hypothetical protein
VLDCYTSSPELVAAYLYETSPDPAELGFYEYRAPWHGPYDRKTIPREPVNIERLPPKLRAKLAALRIPRSFSTIDVLVPEHFTACRYWGQ